MGVEGLYWPNTTKPVLETVPYLKNLDHIENYLCLKMPLNTPPQFQQAHICFTVLCMWYATISLMGLGIKWIRCLQRIVLLTCLHCRFLPPPALTPCIYPLLPFIEIIICKMFPSLCYIILWKLICISLQLPPKYVWQTRKFKDMKHKGWDIWERLK